MIKDLSIRDKSDSWIRETAAKHESFVISWLYISLWNAIAFVQRTRIYRVDILD